MDKQKIELAVHDFLVAIGENPEREGLIETPKRVAKMCEEVLAGIQYSNHDIATMFSKSFEASQDDNCDSVVVMKNIEVFSYCEHHLALMYDMAVNVAYLPHGKVIGLSKIARICDMAAKRLQLQEKLGHDIAEIIAEATGSPDVGVLITGSHSCMTARGIKSTQARTTTKTLLGAFRQDEKLQRLIE
jgi:GTP cyclohydrolase I